MLFAVACGRGETHSPFAATSGVTRHNIGDAGKARFVPLRPMTGDVEILQGDPEKTGEAFVMRINELPGTKIPVHSHPVDENITVVRGTWYFAIGEKWDRTALRALNTGDYAYAPKGSSMFAYCPDGAVVQVHGIGPFNIHWRHGLKTLDDKNAAATFTFRRGDVISSARGVGTIRQGYASGDIIQYEVLLKTGAVVMVDQSEARHASQ